MKPEDWSRIQDLFYAAMALPEAQREAFARHACGSDPALLAELLSLLGAGASGVSLAHVIGEASLDVGAPGPGMRIGPYEILSEVGRGGMGIVYLAERADGEYRKQVAVKIVRLSYASENLSARFRAERQILANLDHPNIARLLDGGTLPSGQPYLVMEYVAGETLDEFCRTRNLAVLERLPLFLQVCEAVAYAHRHHVVHRDLKPGNILVDADGMVKLLDFGTAKLMEGAPPYHTLTRERRLTPAYASPEQILNRPVGQATDIYSLGVILYELIAGRHPFETDRETPYAMERAICEKDPPRLTQTATDRDLGTPGRMPADVRALKNTLDTIVSTAMRKDPAARYGSVAELEGDIRACIVAGPSRLRARKAAGMMARRASIVILSAAVLVSLGVLGWEKLHSPPHRASLPVDIKVTSYPGWERSPSFSPDGSQLVFSWAPEKIGGGSIYVVMAEGGPPRRLTTPAGYDEAPVWSPDGSTIAFLRNSRDVMLISPLGGTERKLTEASYPCLAWSPDSRSLAIVDKPAKEPFSIFEVSVANGERRRLTSPSSKKLDAGDFHMAYSPDGKTLAFFRSVGTGHLLLLSRSTGTLVSLLKQDESIYGITWTLDSKELVYSSGRLGSMKLFRLPVSSPRSPAVVPTFVEEAVEPAIGRLGMGAAAGMRLAYVGEEQRPEIWQQALLDNSGRPRPFSPSTSAESSPQFSPDGRRVVFVSARTGFDELWTSSAAGQDPTQLTFFREGIVGSPRWSPDGQRIVFDYLMSGQRALYVVGANGGSPIRWTGWGEVGRPSFSRDGHWIYFFSTRSGSKQVWKVSGSEPLGRLSEPVQVTTDGGFEAYESPDGASLCFNRERELRRQPVAGGAAEHVLDGVWHGWWTVTSQGIYFADLHEGYGPQAAKPVNFYSFETRRIARIASIDGEVLPDLPDFCVSPDGRRMLFATERSSNADIHMLDPFE